MESLVIKKHISDNILVLDELKKFIGMNVNIVIYPDDSKEQASGKKEKIPSWVGNYSSNGKLIDDRATIYR
jgi:hypothetical protein